VNRPETAIFDKRTQSLLSSQTFLVMVALTRSDVIVASFEEIKIPLMSEVPIN